MKRIVILSAAMSWAALTLQSAQGHHALAANYDVDNIGTIEGLVVEVFWANPHIHYYMEVMNDAGETELWDIESSNVSTMQRSGWERNTIEVGDRVRISGRLGRNGIRRMELDKESLEVLE
ncbi:MAG: DUF6152 family protein [Candidatus Rariloculaceae bacterium]